MEETGRVEIELTNEQRKYLGLELVDPAWDRVELPSNSVNPELSNGKIILYFDKEVLRKQISVIHTGEYPEYLEQIRHIRTQDHRTMIAPKTGKGKPKRLNGVNLQRCTSEGVYFRYVGGSVILANYTTQQTYYSSGFAGVSCLSLQDFLAKWIAETDAEELARIQAFAKAKRRHCKFKEGDFFRFSIDRTHYGYGRILLDIHQMRKNGEEFWDILMTRPLVVSVYHIITEDPSVDLEILQTLKSCPSQFIMDNRFYYGDYEIVGHAPLPEELDYPIMYGKGISPTTRNMIMYQRGHVYKKIPLEGNMLVGDFKNNGISPSLNLNKKILLNCIETDSNEPYWERVGFSCDLRHPKFKSELEQVLKQMEG